jgi:hypothetical protein
MTIKALPNWYFILLGACLTVACNSATDEETDSSLGAATAAKSDAGKGAKSDAGKGDGGRSSDASTDSASSGCKGGTHQYSDNGDGGASGSMIALCASVSIDGKECVVDPTNVALDLGLDGHGWTVHANVDDCFGGAILTISGVDDAAYPQTNVRPFLSEASAWLATNDDSADDAGVGVGPFSSSPDGSSRVEQGPLATSGAVTVGVVRGTALVVATGGESRDVVFDFSF